MTPKTTSQRRHWSLGTWQMAIKPATTYRFTKSGNLVRTVSATNYGGRDNWIVARVDTGKEMIVPGRALIHPNHADWS